MPVAQYPITPFFYGPDALPDAQPTVSKHWRHWFCASNELTENSNVQTYSDSVDSSWNMYWLHWCCPLVSQLEYTQMNTQMNWCTDIQTLSTRCSQYNAPPKLKVQSFAICCKNSSLLFVNGQKQSPVSKEILFHTVLQDHNQQSMCTRPKWPSQCCHLFCPAWGSWVAVASPAYNNNQCCMSNVCTMWKASFSYYLFCTFCLTVRSKTTVCVCVRINYPG